MEEEQIYEELENERLFHQKKGNGKLFFFILLFLILVGIGGYFMLKNHPKKEEKKEEKPTIVENEGYQVEFECDGKCTYDIELSSEKVTVTYEKTKNEDYTYLDKVTIGDTVVSNKNHLCGGPATLGVLEDVILISYHDGCDIGGNTIYAYTKDGSEIFHYEYLDENLHLWLDSTSYKIKNSKIVVGATRLYHGNTLRLDSKREVNLCEKTEWDFYGIDEKTIVSGTYEIEYEGKGVFKEPKLVNEKIVKSVLNICEEV